MKMNPRQQEYYDSLTPIEKIMYQYDESEKGSAEAATLMNKAWSLVETFEEVVAVGDNTPITWEEFFTKAFTLAKTKDNISDLFHRVDYTSEEGLMLLDKFLELCQYKEDIEEEMDRIFDSLSASLEMEEHFIRMFKRGHELPPRTESAEPDDE